MIVIILVSFVCALCLGVVMVHPAPPQREEVYVPKYDDKPRVNYTKEPTDKLLIRLRAYDDELKKKAMQDDIARRNVEAIEKCRMDNKKRSKEIFDKLSDEEKDKWVKIKLSSANDTRLHLQTRNIDLS